MPHTLDLKRLDEVYDAIIDNFEQLSKWEQNFITNTRDQWERIHQLSDGQLEKLEQIYVKLP